MDALPSATALLDQVAPARQAIAVAQAQVTIGGPHYVALETALAALDRLASNLGHEGRFALAAHGMPGVRGIGR